MKKKRKWKTVILAAVLLGLAVAGAAFLMNLVTEKGEPVGTPNIPPVVDQRPVAGSEPSEENGKHENSGSMASGTASENVLPAESGDDSAESKIAASESSMNSTQEEKILHGTIVDAATSTVTIKSSQTGEELSFMRETAEVTGRLVENAEVDIYYIGKIEGNDTAGAYVTRIIAYP